MLPKIFNSESLPRLSTAFLRLSPLMLSSASLMYCWAQDVLFRAFVHPKLKADPEYSSGRFLPRYMRVFLPPALKGILFTHPPIMILSVANGLTSRGTEISGLYFAAAAFSLGHFVWAPSMTAILHRIEDERNAGVEAEKEMESWLPKHHNRTWLVNVPAYLCLLMATMVGFVGGSS